ncbi:hypothetical protein [Maribacter sp. 2307ULW6-5]|uniref:hypothetical protein n=1 Tax=Maribacter sp. 2307ULW6-5 TaxID=3386275 RepID=UPI0039BC502F
MYWTKISATFLALLLLGCGARGGIALTTNGFGLQLNGKGHVAAIMDPADGARYEHTAEPSPLLALKLDTTLVLPERLAFDQEEGVLTLGYPVHDLEAKIKVVQNQRYLTFELIALSDATLVELVLWGPFRTTIGQTIGETVGVVRNTDFSVGIQALNMRTLGGFPTYDDDATPSYDIFGTTSLVDVSDSLNILYRGHTALPREYGSSLQAYTRNRDRDRQVAAMKHDAFMAPAYVDKGLIGSKIALFGGPPEEVLNTLEAIELEEGLPHPTLNGVWSKRSEAATAAYLIQNFSVQTVDSAIALTKKAGLKYLYHSGPFKNWGHFDLHPDAFPDNWSSLKECVDKAERQGVAVGVHTLSNFITTNDPYVTPVPDDRLAKVGSSVLVRDVGSADKTIEIADPVFFDQMENNTLQAVMVGKEIIRYEKVSETAPWLLLNCERGAFGTRVGHHKAQAPIHKLADHPYKTLLTNVELGQEMARRLADLFNDTGLRQISFDGLEGNYSTGMGAYGELLFVDAWYKGLAPEIKDNYIMDASRPGHYFWHMFTRMNWGEPWYAGFRESQTAYRLLNQDYFRRNFIPCMLGWFSMRESTSVEDMEWMLARSAAFDAGYALVTSVDIVAKNGVGETILEKIKQWEKARMSGAFSADQKKRMENIGEEFSLETLSETSWHLIPWSVERLEHPFKVRQPGEPLSSRFSWVNKNKGQALQFILTTKNTDVSNIVLELNKVNRVQLAVSLKEGEFLNYDGGAQAVLYDANWNSIKTVPVPLDALAVGQGEHHLTVSCDFTEKSGTALLKLELKTAGEPELVQMP